MQWKVFASETHRRLTVDILSIAIGSVALRASEGPQRRWYEALMPRSVTIQYAGNIGAVSCGPGWIYGRREQWETQLLIGYLPEEVMFNDYFCLTARQCYTPFRIDMGERLSIDPLTTSVAVNTLFSGEFWYDEPGSKYYNFSTRLRFHFGMGSRLNLAIPQREGSSSNKKQRHASSSDKKRQQRLSLYYELSTYDLALLSYSRGGYIGLGDIVYLGLGIRYQF